MLKSSLTLLFIFLLSTSFINIAVNNINQSISKLDLRSGKDYALFFAVQDYDEWKDLRNPIKDAEAIAKELREEYGFTQENIEVVRNPSKREIYRKLNSYAQKSFPSDGQLFIFFSGHGEFRTTSKEGFFIPRDGRRNDPFQESYIPHTRLARILDNIPCNHVLLALDACYSGTFDEQIAYKGYGRRPGESKTDASEDIVRRQLKNRSRLFITSGGKERTPDGNQHSPFTQRLLEGLRSYGIQDKVLTFSEWIGFIELAKPTPRYGKFGSHAGGGFVLVTTSTTRKSPSVPNDEREETLWQITSDQNTPMAYRFYLNTYPEGKYKTTAMERLKTPPDDLVFIQGGTFTMGCTSEQGDECEDNEKPAHQVTVDDFYLARTEVSRGEFRAFVAETGYVTTAEKEGTAFGLKDGYWGYHPGLDWEDMGFIQTDDHPVIGVSWYDAVAFCNWKSEQEGLQPSYQISGETVNCTWNANGYRLPTEAEWEFAARSRGRAYKYAWGNGEPSGNIADEILKKQHSNWTVWEDYNDGYIYTAPVGKFEQGDLGLADMTGNAWEWCWDWYDSDYYTNSPQRNPRGVESGSNRVVRGGSWYSEPAFQRVANRRYSTPSYRNSNIGFRILRAAG